MLKINAPDTASKEITPKIFITRKSIFFNELEEKRNSFRYNENHLTFHYTALWFKSPNSLKYRYKLEGFDIDWNAQTNLKRVTYSNLPPGDYTFRVQVHYSGGTWTGSPSSRFSFTITPPFWKRAWFIIAMVLLGLTGIFTFIRVRLRNLERAKELLEEEVRKRTLEIQKQKDQIQKQKDEIEAQRDFVVEQRDKIEKQNEDITASIHYASKIQNAVLPPESIFKKELGDNFIFYRPKDIVSGDFYYLNQAGDKLIVAAADCTGHGVPGAFMSMLGISSLNRIISQLPKNANAGKILTALREEIKHALRQTGKEGEAKDGMDMSLCVIDRKQKFLDFAGAYNSLLISRKDEMIRHKGDRMPIGIHLKEKDFFTNKTIEVQDGDMLYLFTDGFQDQVGGEQKHKYMVKPLNQFLHGISGKPAQEQKILVQEEFDHWKGDLPQIDDVLVMGFRV
jgi:serine phosphatase RsbU (regulator of sigma subunit)